MLNGLCVTETLKHAQKVQTELSTQPGPFLQSRVIPIQRKKNTLICVSSNNIEVEKKAAAVLFFLCEVMQCS